MTVFWKAIKEYRAKRKRKGKGIEKEKWLEYFKKLLGEEENEGVGRKRITRKTRRRVREGWRKVKTKV